MIGVVMGKVKKPYRLDNGKSGVSSRVSLFIGNYDSIAEDEQVGEGNQYIEVKCPVNISDQLNVNDELFVELDDGKTRIKSAMLKTSDGYMPL